jgi:hypothetical protein
MGGCMSIIDFVRESNKIEGILREPTPQEVAAHENILWSKRIKIVDLQDFVSIVQPKAVLRDRAGLNVRVGNHYPIKGGPAVPHILQDILDCANKRGPYATHHAYESLHPFTDGNGRSGRALWLWGMDQIGEMDRALDLGFLHSWYYQTLIHGNQR